VVDFGVDQIDRGLVAGGDCLETCGVGSGRKSGEHFSTIHFKKLIWTRRDDIAMQAFRKFPSFPEHWQSHWKKWSSLQDGRGNPFVLSVAITLCKIIGGVGLKASEDRHRRHHK
jgi:hypothetical protein